MSEFYKPKKSRKMKVVKKDAPTYVAAGRALQEIPKMQLQHILMASGEPKMISVARCMDDPNKNRYTLVELCAMNSVSLKDVAQMFKEAKIAEATLAQMEHAPAILESNAIASIGRKMPCPVCSQEGFVGPCLTCNDTKWVQEAGDANAVKGFLETAGLTKQGGGIHIGVGISQNFSGGAFEDLMRDAERKVVNVIEATKGD